MDKTRDTASGAAPGEFFIPDLCNVQAVLFMILVAELLALVLELAAVGLPGFSWPAFALTSLFVLWSFLISAGLLCKLRTRLSHWPLSAAAMLCYLLIVAVVALISLVGQSLIGLDGEAPRIDPWRLATHVLICAVLAGIALRYFYLTQQLRLRQKAELQARIQALQSRIRPHFLFNSMNIIASLIAIDQEAAEAAVEDLAALFRASLAEADTEVTLAEELGLCRRYAHIEMLRLGDRLQMEWRVDSLPATARIPGLTLQPLLENAIYHGIQQVPEGGTVTIEGEVSEGLLTLRVLNPVASVDTATQIKADGNRLAQQNIHARLRALYGPRAGLKTALEGGVHCATICYPFREQETGELA